MNNSQDLEKEHILKLLIKNALPAILGNIVFALYNIINRIFIGKGLGSDALAGVSLVFPFFTVIIGLGMLVGIGAGIMVSIKLGEKNKKYAEKVLGNVFSIYFIFSIILIILGFIFLDPMLKLFGASPATLPYAKQYIVIILPFIFFQFTSMGVNSIVRAEANAKMAMITILIATAINAILDPIFIFYFKMGVIGAGIATVISMISSNIWIIYHFTKGKHRILNLRINNLKLDLKIALSICKIGFPAFFMQIIASFITVIFNQALYKNGGDLAIGAMGIINTIFMIVFMSLIGLNQGGQPIIGYNHGAKNYTRVREILIYSVFLGSFITVPAFLIIQIFPSQIVNLFCKNDPKLLSMTVHGLKIFTSMIILMGFNLAVINFFQATGKPKEAMLLNFLRQIIIFIPCILIFSKIYGLKGIWYTGPVVDILLFIILLLVFLKQLKTLKHKSTETVNI
jgi:putative MATE family efflux protein